MLGAAARRTTPTAPGARRRQRLADARRPARERSRRPGVDVASTSTRRAACAPGRRRTPPATAIVQEALTNTLRHAGPTSARVRVVRADDRVRARGRGRRRHRPADRSRDSGVGPRAAAACASAPPRWAARSTPGRAPAAAGGSPASLPVGRPDPGVGARLGVPAARRPIPHGTSADPIRVLLVDDQALVRAGFRALLDSDPGHRGGRRGRRRRGGGARSRVQTRPDVVLMDVRMPRRRRARGHGADLRRPRAGRHPGRGADDLRARRLRLRRPARRRRPGSCSRTSSRRRSSTPSGSCTTGQALLAPRVTRRLVEAFVADGTAARRAGARHGARRGSRSSPRGSARSWRWSARDVQPRDRRRPRALAADRQDPRLAALPKLGARDRAQLVVHAYETGLVTAGS